MLYYIIKMSKRNEKMGEFGYIKSNLDKISEKIAGRARLVCVCKSASDEELIALAKLGVTDLAENRPQELKRRYELLIGLGFSPNMHQIGTLQRNKVKLIAPFCESIQSLDSKRLADDISKFAIQNGRKIDVLIEVNSAREEQKSGVMPEEAKELLDYVASLPGIRARGLMTMGPVCENPEDLRSYFRETKQLFDSLSGYFADEPILSMGMSESYLVAISEGANLVRIGRLLFEK